MRPSMSLNDILNFDF